MYWFYPKHSYQVPTYTSKELSQTMYFAIVLFSADCNRKLEKKLAEHFF